MKSRIDRSENPLGWDTFKVMIDDREVSSFDRYGAAERFLYKYLSDQVFIMNSDGHIVTAPHEDARAFRNIIDAFVHRQG